MNEPIIRADRRGRLRYTAEQKQMLIEAYESSGLSGSKFASCLWFLRSRITGKAALQV